MNIFRAVQHMQRCFPLRSYSSRAEHIQLCFPLHSFDPSRAVQHMQEASGFTDSTRGQRIHLRVCGFNFFTLVYGFKDSNGFTDSPKFFFFVSWMRTEPLTPPPQGVIHTQSHTNWHKTDSKLTHDSPMISQGLRRIRGNGWGETGGLRACSAGSEIGGGEPWIKTIDGISRFLIPRNAPSGSC